MRDHIPDALITAFERQYDSSWNDPKLRKERLAMRYGWAAAMEAKPCLHQIQEPTPVLVAQPQLHAALFAARGALQHMKEGGKPTQSLLNEAIAAIDSVAVTQAAPAAVAVPDAVRDAEKLLRAEAARLARIYGSNKWYGFSAEKESYLEHLRAAAALAATPQNHIADAGQMVENVREGAPYENPAFEKLARELGVWGTAQSAVCAQFWLAATPAAVDVVRYPTEADPATETLLVLNNSDKLIETPPAAPVVLPEPDAAVMEVMRLVDELRILSIGHGQRFSGISTASDQAFDESANMLTHQSSAIESKLRALLAGVSAPAAQCNSKLLNAARTLNALRAEYQRETDEVHPGNENWSQRFSNGYATLMDAVIDVQLTSAAPAASEQDALPLAAYLCIEESGVIDFEVIPPCTLPPGEYNLYAKSRATQAAQQGGAA